MIFYRSYIQIRRYAKTRLSMAPLSIPLSSRLSQRVSIAIARGNAFSILQCSPSSNSHLKPNPSFSPSLTLTWQFIIVLFKIDNKNKIRALYLLYIVHVHCTCTLNLCLVSYCQWYLPMLMLLTDNRILLYFLRGVLKYHNHLFMQTLNVTFSLSDLFRQRLRKSV